MEQQLAVTEHIGIEPKILYYGMPVILATTLNEDGTTNISPLSSSWALGHYVVLGMGVGGKALDNVRRTPELVVNIPDAKLWTHVEKLAPLTGADPVPENKRQLGFRFEKEKFAASGLTPMPSSSVKPQRVRECPLQIECTVTDVRIPDEAPFFAVVTTKAVRIHAHSGLVKDGSHIDPSLWNPLIYNFRHYYSLGEHLGKTYRAQV